MIKLFVFDLGKVILPFEHRQIAVKLHEASMIRDRFKPDDVFQFLFDHSRGFVNVYEEGRTTSREFFMKLRERYKLDLEFEEFKEIWNNIFEEDPAVNEVILYLKKKGYPVFLLSNTNELHFAHIIEKYPIVNYLDEWILSFEVGAKKPSEKIYDTIFEKKTVERHEVLYIDDIPQYVEAAASYGIPGIVFREAADIWKVIHENCV
ncbi:MAG TPA: HAD family phosphatase [Syntrophorhabdaceae bacterium]|nr:HAD family phosphatase [Syntrophorhabdaceae bacterium]